MGSKKKRKGPPVLLTINYPEVPKMRFIHKDKKERGIVWVFVTPIVTK